MIGELSQDFGAPVVRPDGRLHRRKSASPALAEQLELLHQSQRDSRGAKVSLLTVAEAAKILRVCTATVYSMVERGELKSLRMSNAIRIVVPDGPLHEDERDMYRAGKRKSAKRTRS